MHRIGYLLIAGSFLFGSYLAVERREGVPVVALIVTLLVGAVGIVLVRVALHRAAHSAEVLTANIGAIEGSLQRLVTKAETLEREQDALGVFKLRHHIDREFPNDLDSFVQARESIAHSFGLAAYAEVMNPFAAGERYLNRVWSASTDGYVDEARTYIGLSKEQFAEALAAFRQVRSA